MKSSMFDRPLFQARVEKQKTKLFPEGALGYLVGPVLALISNSFLSSYLTKYYTDVLGLQKSAGIYLVLLQVLSVILVVVGNLVVGRLMNKFNTKAGKARPLLLISMPLIALSLLCIFWFTPFPETVDGSVKNLPIILIVVGIGYNLYYSVGYPFYYASHAALVGLSSRDSKARDLLATLSNAAVLGAMGACTMIFPFFLDKVFQEASKAYDILKWVSLALIVVTILGTIVEFLFTRERITEEKLENNEASQEEQKIAISQQWKVCSKDKFWWIMIAFFFLYQLGGMLKNCSQLYYCNAFWGKGLTIEEINSAGGDKSGTLALIGAVPTALGMFAVLPLANKFGKGKLILGGAVLAVAGGILGMFAGDNYVLAVIAFIIKALGGAPAMYISLALLANVSDHQEAKHGFRCDGLSMAIYGAIMVGMAGLANGIITGILSACGYDASLGMAGVASDKIQKAMSWVFFGGETICFALIAVMFIFMNVEKYTKEDAAILAAKNAPVAEEAPVEEAAAE